VLASTLTFADHKKAQGLITMLRRKIKGAARNFFRPDGAWKFLGNSNLGRRSRIRFALGCFLSGFQPF
jgi:hypothetical protein